MEQEQPTRVERRSSISGALPTGTNPTEATGAGSSASRSILTQQNPRMRSLLLLFDTHPDIAAMDTDAADTRRALAEVRLGRFHVLSASMMAMAVAGAFITPIIAPNPETLRVSLGALAFLFTSFTCLSAYLAYRPRIYPWVVYVLMTAVNLGILLAHYAFGVFSSITAAICLGLMLFASAVARRLAYTTYTILVVGYLITATIPLYFPATYTPMLWIRVPEGAWGFGVVTVLMIYTASFAAGRLLRAQNTASVLRLEEAIRLASQRKAALLEAREALQRVAGIGEPGRFTGQQLDQFTLGVVIGRGGMGEVYEAQAPEHVTPVAVKVIRRELFEGPDMLKRFAHEANLAASLVSPHLVRVLAVGGQQAPIPYIAMERLQGTDLAARLREDGRLPMAEVARLLLQVAQGLSVAHEAGVVHRDLKPQNLFLSTDPQHDATWKVLDFGVAKQVGAEVTQTAGNVVGTPQYMAPEQARGDKPTPLADVYSLGVVAYRCLTGELPYRETDPLRLLHALQTQRPRTPCAFLNLNRQLEGVLALALARKPKHRFQSAEHFARAFDEARRLELDAATLAKAESVLASHPWHRG